MTLPPPRARRLGLPVAVLLLLAAAVVPLAWAAPGAPSSARPAFTAGVPQTWSSGTSQISNVTDTQFGSSFVDGYRSTTSLVVRATNLSATEVQFETWANSSGRSYTASCTPDCSSPTVSQTSVETSNSTDHLIEVFTSQATVRYNGSALPALGLLNASEQFGGALAVEAASTGPNATSGTVAMTRSGGGWIDFGSPGLGLVPWVLPNASYPAYGTSAPEAWNGTAAFTASLATAQNTTVSGIFTSAYGGSANGSGPGTVGSNGNLTSGGPLPPPPVAFYVGPFAPPSLACPWNRTVTANGTAGGDLWASSSCRSTAPGSETALGYRFGLPYYAGSGSANGSAGTSGPCNCSPMPWNGSADAPVVLATDGPYTPSAAVTSVLPGSDLFGGAARAWGSVFAANGGGYGYPLGGLPGGYPVSGSPGSVIPPGQVPPNGPAPVTSGPRPTGPGGPVPALSPATQAMGIGVIVLVVVAVLVGAVLVTRRGRRPPPVA